MILALTRDLNDQQRKIISRLRRQKQVSYDQITGLFQDIQSDWHKANPNANGIDWNNGTTTINNQDVPGKLLPLQFSTTVVDAITGEHQVHVSLGVREAGTRVGIHVHESGGMTFVLDGGGAITDFVEGFEDTFNPEGHYYYMPSDIPMSAANLSKDPVLLMDIFVTPIGGPPITILEPGYPGFVDQPARTSWWPA